VGGVLKLLVVVFFRRIPTGAREARHASIPVPATRFGWPKTPVRTWIQDWWAPRDLLNLCFEGVWSDVRPPERPMDSGSNSQRAPDLGANRMGGPRFLEFRAPSLRPYIMGTETSDACRIC
jgi:hypothetical protein